MMCYMIVQVSNTSNNSLFLILLILNSMQLRLYNNNQGVFLEECRNMHNPKHFVNITRGILKVWDSCKTNFKGTVDINAIL